MKQLAKWVGLSLLILLPSHLVADGSSEDSDLVGYSELETTASPRVGFPYYGRDLRMLVQNQSQQMFLSERGQFLLVVSGVGAPDGSKTEARFLVRVDEPLERAITHSLAALGVECIYGKGPFLRIPDHTNASLTSFAVSDIVRCQVHPTDPDSPSGEALGVLLKRKMRGGDVVVLELTGGGYPSWKRAEGISALPLQ